MSSNDGTTRSESLTPDEARAFYPDEMTMRDARQKYFSRTGFDDNTYVDPWMALPVGMFTVKLPNIAARKAAVRIHDLNHVLTGYGTDWHGEFNISAWELGMGIGRYWAAWVLNAGGLAAGLVLWPKEMVTSYARGRATRQSLYTVLSAWDDGFLDKTVGEVRALVGVADVGTPLARDRLAMVTQALLATALHLAPVVVAVGIIVVGVRAVLAN